MSQTLAQDISLRRVFLLAAVLTLMAVVIVALGATSARADGVVCGQVVTSDLTLTTDLIGCPGDGLIVEANVTVNLNGHTIRGSGQGVGVLARGDRVTVMNGTITNFGTGLDADFRLYLTARHLIVTRNTGNGIFRSVRLNPFSLFEDVIASFNGGDGIEVGGGDGVRISMSA